MSRRVRLALATALGLLAVLAALAALDARAWRDAIARGDETYRTAPGRARWGAQTRLPGDPVGKLLGFEDDLELRRAIRAFVVAESTPRGFDNGALRSQARAQAAGVLATMAASANRRFSAQANDLLGVLAATGEAAGAVNDEQGARVSFDAGARSDPRNVSVKFNLELLLRRSRTAGTREDPGRGSGPRGGAGAGSTRAGGGY
jgi:hypothetical protein